MKKQEQKIDMKYKYILEENKLFDNISLRGSLTGQDLQKLDLKFGKRFWKALKITIEGGVKKYIFKPSNIILWIVVGKQEEYVIFDNLYCSCYDFYMNTVLRGENTRCYHLIAKAIAEALNLFETYILSDSRYKRLMREWSNFSMPKD